MKKVTMNYKTLFKKILIILPLVLQGCGGGEVDLSTMKRDIETLHSNLNLEINARKKIGEETKELLSEISLLRNYIDELEKAEKGAIHTYLRVLDASRIRRTPDTNDETNTLAIAYKGDHLRVLDCIEYNKTGESTDKSQNGCEWYLVSFMINGGGLLRGYIYNTIVEKLEISDPKYVEYTKFNNIRYLWEDEVINIIPKGTVVGLSIETGEYPMSYTNFRDRIMMHMLREGVKTKIIPSKPSDREIFIDNINRYSSEYGTESILHIFNDGEAVRVYLYGHDNTMMFVSFIPTIYFETNREVEVITSS